MKDTKLIELLSSLSVWELKSFEKYVASPFFNVSSTVSKLLEVLIKHYPEFDSEKLTEQNIYKDLFVKQRFNHQRLRYVMTDLTFLLQDCLSQDSKTLMIVCVSPVLFNVEETFCSLNFASRVRTIELGKASKNVSKDGKKSGAK